MAPLVDLTESRMFKTTSSFEKYNLRDINDLTFIYCCALEMLTHDFNFGVIAVEYAKHTLRQNGFSRRNIMSNDLYNLFWVLTNRNFDILRPSTGNINLENHMGTISEYHARMFLRNIIKPNDPSYTRRYLLKMQSDLAIQESNMRSMRILVANWANNTTEQKSLVVTRMLQILRSRFHTSELLPILEKYAKLQDFEIREKSKERKSSGGLWKDVLAGAAAIGAGAYAGKKLADRNQRGKK